MEITTEQWAQIQQRIKDIFEHGHGELNIKIINSDTIILSGGVIDKIVCG